MFINEGASRESPPGQECACSHKTKLAALAFQRLEASSDLGRHASALALVAPSSRTQKVPRNASNLISTQSLSNRIDDRLRVRHHRHRPCTNLGRKLARRFARIGSPNSEARVSGRPDAARFNRTMPLILAPAKC
mgnify:CR=1 FL=1